LSSTNIWQANKIPFLTNYAQRCGTAHTQW
jgi:hypothetical protein